MIQEQTDLKPIRCIACHKLLVYADGLTGVTHIQCPRCRFLNSLKGGISIIPELNGRKRSTLRPVSLKSVSLEDIVKVMEERWAAKWRDTTYKKSQMATGLRFEVFYRDNFRCQYCGRAAVDGAILEVDHKTPKAEGGTNDKSNLITACWECNSGKSKKLLTVFPLGG